MNDWMNDFLDRCLAGVPQGSYRNRTEQEFRDHLTVLAQDLEGAGYVRAEARMLALERMGDPAELARRCLREWRRRRLGRQCLLTGNLFVLALVIFVVGMLYTFNTRNFGKVWVAYWGLTAILITQIMLHSSYLSRSGTWTVTRWASLSFVVIQGPPIFFWVVCGSAFEFSGVLVPAPVGFLVHLLFLAWGLANYMALEECHKKECPTV